MQKTNDDALTPSYTPTTLTIELIRRPNGNGFETVSYKVSASGNRIAAVKEIDAAVAELELAYGKQNQRHTNQYNR